MNQGHSTVPDLFKCKVLAFDPGLTIGWAAFAYNGYPFATGEIKNSGGMNEYTLKETVVFLAELTNMPEIMVCEDFIVAPTNKLYGQRVIASEVIGVIRTFSVLKRIPLVMSPSKNLPRGLKRAGITMPQNHAKTHVPSAIAHGTFYVTESGIRPILPESSGYRQISNEEFKQKLGRKDPA